MEPISSKVWGHRVLHGCGENGLDNFERDSMTGRLRGRVCETLKKYLESGRRWKERAAENKQKRREVTFGEEW